MMDMSRPVDKDVVDRNNDARPLVAEHRFERQDVIPNALRTA